MAHTLTLKKSKYDRFTLKVELTGPYPSGGDGPDNYLI